MATYLRTVDRNPWIPDYAKPRSNAKQRQFLLLSDVPEILYGGAAGGGKTYASLIAAAQFVDVPGYSALLLRKSFSDLSQPQAWLPLSKSWWLNKGAHWSSSEHRWTFPSGATITFGYLENDDSVYQYDSAAYQFIGVDELTQHTEWRYRFMFGRIRRPKIGPLSQVPLRMRATSNPGNKGHGWVKKRFVDPKTRNKGSLYIPARLSDNAGNLDVEAYRRQSLSQLDPVTRRQREEGDWDASAGGVLKGIWFKRIGTHRAVANRVRSRDKAGTQDGGCFTAGVLQSRIDPGLYTVEDVRKGQWSYYNREQEIVKTAHSDRARFGYVKIIIEQEPGSGGLESAMRTVQMLQGFDVTIDRVTGSKEERMGPFATQLEAGNVYIVDGQDWTEDYLDEADTFPNGKYVDQMDATSGGFNYLASTFGYADGQDESGSPDYPVRPEDYETDTVIDRLPSYTFN